MTNEKKTVAFIGTGNMGGALARGREEPAVRETAACQPQPGKGEKAL